MWGGIYAVLFSFSTVLSFENPLKNGLQFYGLNAIGVKCTVFGNYGLKIWVKCDMANIIGVKRPVLIVMRIHQNYY